MMYQMATYTGTISGFDENCESVASEALGVDILLLNFSVERTLPFVPYGVS